jgi:transcriptional regulator with XRE-family HTH domain
MAQPRPNEQDQPAVMKLIRERRKQMHLSYGRAGAHAGISDTRWRQLENGYRTIKGVGRIPEDAPPVTLAKMAYVVGVTVSELNDAGRGEAAAELRQLAEDRAQADGEAQAEAERMVSVVGGLTKAQRERLMTEVAADLRRIRSDR